MILVETVLIAMFTQVPRKLKAGFALMELLLVMVVLTLLLSLLLSGIRLGRNRADEAKCISNVHAIDQALIMYVVDYDSRFPPIVATNWTNDQSQSELDWLCLIFRDANKEVKPCPVVETPGWLKEHRGDHNTFGYAYNGRLNFVSGSIQSEQEVGKSESIVTYPSLTVSAFEARSGITACAAPDLGRANKDLNCIFSTDALPQILAQTEGAYRHQGGANYAFVDGHVKWLKPENIRRDKRNDGLHVGFGL